MKGYTVENGYMGYVDGKYMLFASECDYLEWIRGWLLFFPCEEKQLFREQSEFRKFRKQFIG